MSSPEEREAIKLNFAQLTKNLNPKDVIDEMRAKSLLTDNEHSDIETNTKENRRDGASALLKALQRRKPGSLTVFISILKKVDGSEYLAKNLAKGEWSSPPLCGAGACDSSGCDEVDPYW